MENPKLASIEYERWLTSVVPDERQMRVLKMGYYNFIHFGINTFTGKEWGNGLEPTEKFALKALDTDKWVLDLLSTGSRGVILTAKHHDGFCLFPSKHTEYSIKNTPYMQGKGDIVGQLAASCKKYNFALGIYLSPWDRHEKTYGTDAYNDYFKAQLTELCTSYGELFCFWFDGACGEGKNGKKQIYDWEGYYSIIRKLQPSAVIANCGPDIRWIGNEAGRARKSEWSVVPTVLRAQDAVASASQQSENDASRLRKIDATDEDLGGRELLLNREICYYPSEMDISASKKGWFYRKAFEWFCARSAKNFVKCYNTSVGNNATLLVNVAPNKAGELPKRFIKRMVAAKKQLLADFAQPIATTFQKEAEDVFSCQCNDTISKVVLAEDVTFSQRIESFALLADGVEVFRGTTVGFKKFCFFPPVYTKLLTLKILSCRLNAQIHSFKPYK